ncbi:prolipoprotein diacylglyceryl transferase [Larkinella harenae]
MLAYVVWRLDPELFRIGPIVFTWYDALVIIGLLATVKLLNRLFGQTRSLLLYVGITTVLGSRLGYFLIDKPVVCLTNPLDVLLPPYQGLSANGAAIGFFLGLLFYAEAHRNLRQPYLWLADRAVVVVPVLVCFVRLGNLMISDGVGQPTNVLWAFVFLQYPEYPAQPRHAVQLYEALTSLLLFGGLCWSWPKSSGGGWPAGRRVGFFLVWMFLLRFCWEYLKENSVSAKGHLWNLTINQLLSIPAVLAGSVLIIRSYWNQQRKPGCPEQDMITALHRRKWEKS